MNSASAHPNFLPRAAKPLAGEMSATRTCHFGKPQLPTEGANKKPAPRAGGAVQNPIPGMALVYGSSAPPSTAWRDFPILSTASALKLPQK
jgi:hypothetical protein